MVPKISFEERFSLGENEGNCRIYLLSLNGYYSWGNEPNWKRENEERRGRIGLSSDTFGIVVRLFLEEKQ